MSDSPFEVMEVNTRKVHCDGGEGPLGHPRVFLKIDETDQTVCPYCSRMFVYTKPHAGYSAAAAH